MESVETLRLDFSQPADFEKVAQHVDVFCPDRLFYIAGGGPYGDFVEKQWKDHQWALQVSFLTPMKLFHHCLKKPFLKQIIAVGSAIAEDKADSGAASYAAAKHGLKGLLHSLQAETDKDVRLFSPGYINTEMLPLAAQSRLAPGVKIHQPEDLAREFIDWARTPNAPWHWRH